MKVENLRQLVNGRDLNAYQRALAKTEFENLEAYAKQSEDVNHLYGLYFDKTLGDGLSPEEAAEELGLA